MLSPTLPLLTLAWLDAVVVIVAILLTVGGWILSAVRSMQEKAEKSRKKHESRLQHERRSMRIDGRSDQDQAVASLTAADEAATPKLTTRQRLDALAAQRRQEMLQARTQATRTGGATGPDNLTAAQKAARERARQVYQQRAELLARQQRQIQEEAARRHAAAQQQQQRQAPAGRPARQPQSQSVRPRPAAASRPATAAPTPRAATPRQYADVAPAMTVTRLDDTPARIDQRDLAIGSQRRERELASRREGSEFSSRQLRQAMNGRSIRAAFILKEALDRPLALRESIDLPGLST